MRRSLELVLAALVLVTVAVFVGLMIAPSAAVYSGVLRESMRSWLASPIKLLLFFLGFFNAMRIAARFDPGSTVRRAWFWLGLGLLCFFLGQLVLAPYQLFLNQATVFPSPADFFFFIGYPFFAVALFLFVGAYAEAGYPLGSAASRRFIVIGTTAVCVLLAFFSLRPIIQAPRPDLLAFALNLAYPLLDLILLVPTVLLIRITWALRGGEVAAVWVAILGGLIFMSAGDILFGYFQAKGVAGVDPLVHVTYIVAYWLIARGVLRQYSLTRAS